ncbi:unnamed protein product [Clonostachys solani]|uniref:Origin recognition complex subunit 3 n=1 Tax=Clonostachys solani TaxID=160281 RepID=A0A9P0EAZ5_9HYPO|nr:unnamed protein product [Clonostachys solani]
MTKNDEPGQAFSQEDHQVAYVFDPNEEESRQQHSSKRRRVSKQTKAATTSTEPASPSFVSLFNGVEKIEFVQAREKLFRESWQRVDSRIQNALRESNSATLDEVAAFVSEAQAESYDKIPSVFIRTGSNIASQNLLFEQLSDCLQRSTPSKFVRLRSSEVTTLKSTLKRIIQDVVRRDIEDEEEDEIQPHTKHLDYDLEALRAFIKPEACDHVFVAFEDSEGFDSTLLSDLIPLLNSWRPRIPFTLLFGIATSVELLQARLLKTACQQIYGAQFDAVQTDAILEAIFKIAVSAGDVPLRLGSPLLKSMLDRQRDQMAGIQAFISSLKYAYMCHFYANPLSSLMSAPLLPQLQPEHIESIRNTPSFRVHVERLIESDDAGEPSNAQSLLENDAYLVEQIESAMTDKQRWVNGLLRSLLIAVASGAVDGDFSTVYCRAMMEGIDDSQVTEQVRRMDVPKLLAFIRQVLSIFQVGEPTVNLSPYEGDDDLFFELALKKLQDGIESLAKLAQEKSITLRSKYMGQTKVMRTTVIAQRVQLSRDSAALSEEDKQYTDYIDELTKLLSRHVTVLPVSHVFLSECWTYDSMSPARDVFVPRPRATFERSLTRPHDYLSCSCCKDNGGGIQSTLPATSILYQLYLETGSLVNVADLWTAFLDIVGEEEGDERKALLLFYRGLAELRTLGFVKSSKKKVDHIAKLKWL